MVSMINKRILELGINGLTLIVIFRGKETRIIIENISQQI